jgi:hypothetical protein
MQVLGAPASFIKHDDWRLVATPLGSSNRFCWKRRTQHIKHYDGLWALDLTAPSAPTPVQTTAQLTGPLHEPRNCDGAISVSVTCGRRVLKLDTGDQS